MEIDLTCFHVTVEKVDSRGRILSQSVRVVCCDRHYWRRLSPFLALFVLVDEERG